MSEFIFSLLILKSDAPKAQAALADLTHPYILQNLNEMWSVIALEQPDDPAYPWILKHSSKFPMLCFQSGDDSWSYIIFHEGAEKASLEINSSLHYSLWREIAEFLYPGIDVHRDLDLTVSRKIDELVFASDAYKQSVRDQFIYTNVDEFAVFGLSPDRIAELEEILQPELAGLHEPNREKAFKAIVGIQDLYWIYGYEYLQNALDEGLL